MAENFSAFLKQNKKTTAEVEYAATKDFTDEKGNPLMWKLSPITSQEFNILREKCTRMIPVVGRKGQYRQQVDVDALNNLMIAACVTYPNLKNSELQDSYNAHTAGELLYAMVSNPGEYNDLLMFCNSLCGFDTSLEDKVEEVKN